MSTVVFMSSGPRGSGELTLVRAILPLLLVGSAIACVAGEPASGGGGDAASARSGIGTTALAAGGDPGMAPERETSLTGALLPGPNSGRGEEAARRDAECRDCHPREAAEWSASMHRRSDVDPAYRAAFAMEPSPFCQGCHAPESALDRAPPPAVSDMGVGCVTCHVPADGVVLAAPSREGKADPSSAIVAPHPIRRSPAFGGPGACAGCHEFRFPAAHGSADGDHMQTTVREHARSRAAGRACADCHMPEVGGRRSHSFAEVRDPAWLRRSLRVTAELGEDGAVRLVLAQTDPGHAFPTGDLFRRLEVGCELRGPGGKVIARDVRYPSRHFPTRGGAAGRVLTGDDRVFDEGVEIDMDLGGREELPPQGTRGARVSWWVTYQRVATIGSGERPEEANVESEVRLHTGELPW